MKFYICEKCNKIFAFLQKEEAPLQCAGEEVKELVPHTKDAGNEKHLPVVEINGNIVTVKVGSIEHPMLDEHFINWVALETKQGNQRKELKPGQKPEVRFAIVEGDEVIAAYEYCNLHGLWKTTL